MFRLQLLSLTILLVSLSSLSRCLSVVFWLSHREDDHWSTWGTKSWSCLGMFRWRIFNPIYIYTRRGRTVVTRHVPAAAELDCIWFCFCFCWVQLFSRVSWLSTPWLCLVSSDVSHVLMRNMTRQNYNKLQHRVYVALSNIFQLKLANIFHQALTAGLSVLKLMTVNVKEASVTLTSR